MEGRADRIGLDIGLVVGDPWSNGRHRSLIADAERNRGDRTLIADKLPADGSAGVQRQMLLPELGRAGRRQIIREGVLIGRIEIFRVARRIIQAELGPRRLIERGDARRKNADEVAGLAAGRTRRGDALCVDELRAAIRDAARIVGQYLLLRVTELQLKTLDYVGVLRVEARRWASAGRKNNRARNADAGRQSDRTNIRRRGAAALLGRRGTATLGNCGATALLGKRSRGAKHGGSSKEKSDRQTRPGLPLRARHDLWMPREFLVRTPIDNSHSHTPQTRHSRCAFQPC